VRRQLVASGAVIVALLAGACEADDPGQDPDEVAATVPDGWQELTFPGGTVAVPPDFEAIDPLGEDVLTVFGPERDEGPPVALRVRVTDRDPVPFEELPSLAGATLVAQFWDVEPAGEEDRAVPGAEEAMVADFRYVATVEGDDVPLHERMLIAWFADDRQLQLRVGGPEALVDQDRGHGDGILSSVALDAD
jgi:hypothetical protein